MSEDNFSSEVTKIINECQNSLDYLLTNNYLNKTDIRVIEEQKTISITAIKKAQTEFDFSDSSRRKLLFALIKDFENSFNNTIEEAIFRRGSTALLVYKLRKVEKSLLKQFDENLYDVTEKATIEKISNAMKRFILNTFQDDRSAKKTKERINSLVKAFEKSLYDAINKDTLLLD